MCSGGRDVSQKVPSKLAGRNSGAVAAVTSRTNSVGSRGLKRPARWEVDSDSDDDKDDDDDRGGGTFSGRVSSDGKDERRSGKVGRGNSSSNSNSYSVGGSTGRGSTSVGSVSGIVGRAGRDSGGEWCDDGESGKGKGVIGGRREKKRKKKKEGSPPQHALSVGSMHDWTTGLGCTNVGSDTPYSGFAIAKKVGIGGLKRGRKEYVVSTFPLGRRHFSCFALTYAIRSCRCTVDMLPLAPRGVICVTIGRAIALDHNVGCSLKHVSPMVNKPAVKRAV